MSSLVTIYITFTRTKLHHADIVSDQTCNSYFHNKLEYVKHNACLIVTGAKRGTYTEKLYQELCLQSLKSMR